ncbi:hypothetical protein ACQR1I_35860 [Bradyrhizobium sp. HKCCYLS2038]|uniref:hypothetical protein n=1 Tax=Bradyrhizobium sp. HKCCYLS2038 TaxID=3420764 RepID=UPI003EBE5422
MFSTALNVTICLVVMVAVTLGYALVLRPILRRLPRFQALYDEADGFWAKAWVYCGHSLTIAWSYILAGVGIAFSLLDKAGLLLGDPELNLQQKTVDLLKDHPQVAGWVVIAFGLITLATRLRTLVN